ncbi:heparin-sulfate lyase HepC [Bacteroides reticulotermitis]|uniref:Heparinase III protein n=2 Tax=Bacteroides reticulotermitis TaxID=1133319 RepID=W4UZZ9_9BACE|nr:heparin-sulfate lyase HepC [Bacteroides reticulotermitis]MBB4046367.1 heparan-sulfate lyase [Bacteroides reticulotermitis]GAE86536.1 heparinase III protein [Bacteroides reticulotermitis JCM 10512]
MRTVRYILTATFLFIAACVEAQQVRKEAFALLNLEQPALEKVKAACTRQHWDEAAQALLDYYRHRNGVVHPDLDLQHIKISKEEQKWADDALGHTFFVHKGYQPSYNYGKDINWEYWPVQDNELRWQLHRHKWFTPMGKAYRLSGDEKYAKEWAYQYIDWIEKNPLTEVEPEEYKLVSAGEVKGDAENVRFAWRPLEVSNRLQDQTLQFLLFVNSPSFTPAFLTEFLVNYHRHALHILNNYSAQGNHLLFEAQRIVYAGAFFPEFKEASSWRESGINTLNREIKKQVYTDGGHYELDPHYHLAAINIFCKALRMADVNGFRQEFPAGYVGTVKHMIEFYSNVCFPDYSNPCFSDAKLGNRSAEVGNYQDWLKIFPDCEWIRYYATEGREGSPLSYLSHGALDSGFFTFRNGWKQDATVMVVKAGPKGEWHCQPDNGTFELWFNGRNLFPDSGSYVYAGDDEVMKLRNWFRQTSVHNTLTLDEKNLQTTESVTRLWQPEGNEQILVTENPHYEDLKHRRSVFFVDQAYFVIIDEAVGNAKGTVNLNYNLCEGTVHVDGKSNTLTSTFEGRSNVKLQCFSEKHMSLTEKEGWRSIAYRQRVPRTAVSFNIDKNTPDAVRYITIIYPVKDTKTSPTFKAKFLNKAYDENGVRIEVSINGKKRQLAYRL